MSSAAWPPGGSFDAPGGSFDAIESGAVSAALSKIASESPVPINYSRYTAKRLRIMLRRRKQISVTIHTLCGEIV